MRLPLALGARPTPRRAAAGAAAVARPTCARWRGARRGGRGPRRRCAAGSPATMRMPGFRRHPGGLAADRGLPRRPARSRALVLPGSGFGLQTWGWTIDEPMQGVAASAWVTRSQVPLVPGPTARYLDTDRTSDRLRRGRRGPGRRCWPEAGSPTSSFAATSTRSSRRRCRPPVRSSALVSAPGLTRVAGFGRSGFGDQAHHRRLRRRRPGPRRVARWPTPMQSTLRRGARRPAHRARGRGVMAPDSPRRDRARPDREAGVVGDHYRRVERQFGRVHDGDQRRSRPGGAVDHRTARTRLSRRARHANGRPRRSSTATAGRVHRAASSSQGYAEELGPVRPEFGPQVGRGRECRHGVAQWVLHDARPSSGSTSGRTSPLRAAA